MPYTKPGIKAQHIARQLTFIVLTAVAILLFHIGMQIATAAPPRSPLTQAGTTYYAKPTASGNGDGLSWTNATTLQGALGLASSGAEIWVATGIYKPTSGNDRTIYFDLVPGVAMYGGFDPDNGIDTFDERDWIAYPTLLSGDIDGNDTNTNGVVTDAANISGNNSFHIVYADGTTGTSITNTTIINGFTITAGQANGAVGSYNNFAGGFFCNGSGINNECSPKLTNIIFSGNSGNNGGGMYSTGDTSGTSNPILTNVTFVGNASTSFAGDGGGMYNAGNNGSSSPILTNVSFSNNSADYGGAMYNAGSSPVLTNVAFFNNSADYGAAMYNSGVFIGGSHGYSRPILTNVTFYNNIANNQGGAMRNSHTGTGSSNPTLTNVILWGDGATNGAEIYNDNVTPTMSNSLIQGGITGTGIVPLNSVNDGGNNLASNPLFVSIFNGDLRLQDNSPALDMGSNSAPSLVGIATDLDGNPRLVDWDGDGTANVDMGAFENQACPVSTRLQVKHDATGNGRGNDWANAQPDLALALTRSTICNVDQIWVATGIYLPGDARTDAFNLVPDVEVYGGFDPDNGIGVFAQRDWIAYPTILSGDIGTANDNSDNSLHVVVANGTDTVITNSTILDGFTIEAGNAEGGFPDNIGGGFYCNGRDSGSICSPKLTRIAFLNNSASFGGAMANDGESGSSSPSLTNIFFSGNSASNGGAIFNNGAFNGSSSPTLINVAFYDNVATNAGGAMYSSGLSSGSGSPSLTNVTFSGNTANEGGAMFNDGRNSGISNPNLTNVILWGNSASIGSEIRNNNATPLLSYSLIQGGINGSGISPANSATDGLNNLAADPQFIDAPNGNLRLQLGSPAADHGDDTASGLIGISKDLDDNNRFIDGDGDGTSTVDIGAYEDNDLCPITTTFYVDHSATGNGSGSNWPNAHPDLAFALDRAASCGGVDEIWVATGTYTPGGNRTDSFILTPGVAVYGGFDPDTGANTFAERDWIANSTTLSGNIGALNSNNDNSFHVVFADGTAGTPITNTTILEGFNIKEGRANGSYPNNHGAGIYCKGIGFSNECSPTLTNIIFSINTATGYGGAMNNSGGSGGKSNPILTNVTFTGNSADFGGAMENSGGGGNSSPILTNVIFSGNSANWGGAMDNSGGSNGNSNPTLTNVTFTGNSATNSGGAMLNSSSSGGSSSPSLTNVTFSGNSATNGGAIYNTPNSGGTSSPSLTNVTFSGNSATDGGAMHNTGSNGGVSSPSLNNVTFSGNSASDRGGAMYNTNGSSGTSSPILTNVIMWGDAAFNKSEIHNNNATPVINFSLVEGFNLTGTGTGNLNGQLPGNNPLFVRVPDSGDGDWTTLNDNDYGDLRLLDSSPAIDMGENSAVSGTLTDLDGNGRIIDGDGNGTEIADLGAYENLACPTTTLLYVDHSAAGNGSGTTWPNARQHLGSALARVAACGTVNNIWVAAGTYTPGPNPEDSFYLTPGVTVHGGFDPAIGADQFNERDWVNNLTILSGDIGGDDTAAANGVITDTANISGTNSSHVVYAAASAGNPMTATTILDGFTITGGQFIGASPNNRGGGFYCLGQGNGNNCSPSLNNLIFSGNLAGAGSAMFNNGSNSGQSNPSLTNVTFSNNTATSAGTMYNWGVISGNSSPTLNDVAFTGNTANNGGGMYNNGNNSGNSNPNLTNVTLFDNTATTQGGAMYNSADNGISSPILTNVTFSGNEATTQGGGAMFNSAPNNGSSNPTLTNVIFYDNSAGSNGGALLNNGINGDSSPTLINVTFSGNTAVNGGAMYNFGATSSNPILTNVIMWGNVATGSEPEIFNNSGAAPIIDHSLIAGLNPTGTNNLDGTDVANDPLFVDAANGDLRLQTGSSAIDTGDNASCPAADLSGVVRPQGAVCDMGAYEFWGLMVTAVAPNVDLSWDNANVSCTYDLFESTTPYFTPVTVSYPNVTSAYLVNGRLGDSNINYFFINRATCGGMITPFSNEVGEFDFAIVPGS